ncbi:MAG: thioredoxin family protein [Desulfurococcaceae archaeon]
MFDESPTRVFDMDMSKVIVEIQLDLSEESDTALRTLFNAAEELLDRYGVWVEIIPIHIWSNDPLESETMDLPRIYINGKLRFIGRAPSKKELISAIMERIGTPPKRAETSAISTKVFFDGGFSEASMITA